MSGIKRSAEKGIRYLLGKFPCVTVIGARQVGKTTLLKRLLPRAPFFDLESDEDYQRISRDPAFFLSQYDTSIVLDEAQRLPELFPALRVAIDKTRNRNGRFLLSGSSSPDLLKNITETLAGRVAIFELGGFSLEEVYERSPNPLYELIEAKKFKEIAHLKPRVPKDKIFQSCLKGAFPEPFLGRDDSKFFRLWMDNYLKTYIQRGIRSLFPGLNLATYQRFIQMLANSSGQLINASEFARSLDVSQPTVKFYLEIAHGTFLWRNLPSYTKNIKRRVAKMPKGHLRDSGLVNHMLRIRTKEDFLGHPHAGRIWESFLIEELIKGFNNHFISAEFFYYRTHNQTEIDLVAVGDFGVLPIELKMGATIHPRSVRAIQDFVRDQKSGLGLVISNCEKPAWFAEKVLALPVTYL